MVGSGDLGAPSSRSPVRCLDHGDEEHPVSRVLLASDLALSSIAWPISAKAALLAVGCKLRGCDNKQTFNRDAAGCSRPLYVVAGRQGHLA